MEFRRKGEKKVYGPYFDSTGKRRIVRIVFFDGTSKTTANARYVLEQHLGRSLTPEEEADHIDENPLNDSIENLQVLAPLENKLKSITPAKVWVGLCPVCGTEFTKPLNKVSHNRKQGKAGPFCGKSCAGRHSAKLESYIYSERKD